MQRLNKEIILNYLQEHKKEFMLKYNLKKIGLFGSYAKDCASNDSDIDILVDMPPSFKNYYELKHTLEEYFHKKVDLGLDNTLRSFVKKRVQKEIIYV